MVILAMTDMQPVQHSHLNFTWTDTTEAGRITDHSRGQVSLASSAARWPSATPFQRKAEGKSNSVPVGLFNSVGQSAEPGLSPGYTCLPRLLLGRYRAVCCGEVCGLQDHSDHERHSQHGVNYCYQFTITSELWHLQELTSQKTFYLILVCEVSCCCHVDMWLFVYLSLFSCITG